MSFKFLSRKNKLKNELIARDLILINILLRRGVITFDDIKQGYTTENILQQIKQIEEIKKENRLRNKE